MAPPKVKAFSRVASLGRINTLDKLQRRHPFMVFSLSIFGMCGKDLEAGNHLFIHCYTIEVWGFLCLSLSRDAQVFTRPCSAMECECKNSAKKVIYGGSVARNCMGYLEGM